QEAADVEADVPGGALPGEAGVHEVPRQVAESRRPARVAVVQEGPGEGNGKRLGKAGIELEIGAHRLFLAVRVSPGVVVEADVLPGLSLEDVRGQHGAAGERVAVANLVVAAFLRQERRVAEDAEELAAGRQHEVVVGRHPGVVGRPEAVDRKSTRLNSSHVKISYAVFCLKKK